MKININILKKIFPLITFSLLSFSVLGQYLSPTDLGEGSIDIGIFLFKPQDAIKKDTAGRMLMRYKYYIHHTLVLRKNESDSTLMTGSKNVRPLTNNNKASTWLKAYMLNPVYLIDWKSKLVYTLDPNNKTKTTIDSLKSDLKDFFFRAWLLESSERAKVVIDTADQEVINIGGFECRKGKYKKDVKGGSWQPFTYTKRSFSIIALLNFKLNVEFPYPVVTIDSEDRNEKDDPEQVTTISRLQILSLDEKPQNLNLFRTFPQPVPPN